MTFAAPIARAKVLPPNFVDTTELGGLDEPVVVRLRADGRGVHRREGGAAEAVLLLRHRDR
jgi:hypothetical protein